jgi:hypothetical protein
MRWSAGANRYVSEPSGRARHFGQFACPAGARQEHAELAHPFGCGEAPRESDGQIGGLDHDLLGCQPMTAGCSLSPTSNRGTLARSMPGRFIRQG